MTDTLWQSIDVARYVGLKGKRADKIVMQWVRAGKLKPYLWTPAGKPRFTKELVDRCFSRRPQ